MGRPPLCNCHCEPPLPPPVDCAPIVCPLAQHSNRAGTVSDYTLSTKTWGTGIAINSLSLVTDATRGHAKPCLKMSVNWSQTKTAPFYFPSLISPGGLGYEPLFASWVIVELNGGPQVSLAAGEWLQDISLQCNTKRVNVTPEIAGIAGYRLEIHPPGNEGVLFTGGTFLLSVNGEVIAPPLSFDADAAAVQAALERLASVGVGGVTVTGGPIGPTTFLIHFTDGESRNLTHDGRSLEPPAVPGSASPLRHHEYSIIPIVMQEGVVYGPTPVLLDPFTMGVSSLDGNEAFWRCRSAASCAGRSISGTGSTVIGTNNLTAHARYNEFLENTLAYPSGVVAPCQAYCRSQDSFGDWEFATIQRANPTVTTSGEVPEWDTWIPPTPDFSLGDYTLGFAVMFWSDEPGDYSADLLIDNLCLDWSVREPLPNCDGATLIVDEPMDTSLPTGWTTSLLNHDPFSGNCDDAGEQYFGANWRIEDGWMITDDVFVTDLLTTPCASYVGNPPYLWRDRIYAGGSIFKQGIGSVVDWKNSNFCMTVECDLQRLHEEDAEWYADDEPNTTANPTSLNLNLHRPEEDFGIFIGGLVKFGVARNKLVYGGSSDNHTCDRSYYYLTVSGNVQTEGSYVTQCQGFGHGSYECPDIDGMGTHRQAYKTANFTTGSLEFNYLNRVVPLKNDRLRLQVRWANLTPGFQDCRAELRFYLRAWLNDQEVFNMTREAGVASDAMTVDVSAGAAETAWIHQPSVGVYAHRGGKFRNFKAWLRPS